MRLPPRHGGMPAVITLFLFVSLFGTVPAKPKFVATQGKRFLAPDGTPILFKGINLGNWLLPEGYMFKFKSANSPRLIQTVFNQLIGEDGAGMFWRTYRDRYITREDIQFVKRAGFNSVRIPFNYRLFVSSDNPSRLDGPGWELVDRAIRWSKEFGLYAVLDMHGAPGGQTGDNIDDSWGYPFLYESEESQALTIRIWCELARRYKNEPAVAGYDLLNEPIPHYLDASHFNPKLEPLYRRIVEAIRRVDTNHIVFLGGAQWNTNFKVFGPPFDNRLAYTFHKYWTEPTQAVIQEYLDFSDQYNVPLWMGESGENTDDWIAKFRDVLEQNGIGWCFWPYKKLDATSCVASIRKTAEWDSITAFANRPRATFEEIRKSRPNRMVVDKALADYLENITFANCRINNGYLKALGLK